MAMFCVTCGATYDDDKTVCDEDGERLVKLEKEPSLVGEVLEGKYSINSELGEGGMGSVYLARQESMGRDVAVKVLRREFSKNEMAIRRFLTEAKTASKLAHPNTITVYDFGQTDEGLLFMVMELLNGKPLDSLVEEEGFLPADRAVHIVAQVCDSLAEAHSQRIFHRDLKPENIFIEPKYGNAEHVKVLDFGIAKMYEEGVTKATATGMICGTPSYMSPEQAMGKEIDGRSDIYSLGILLYELLAGKLPFQGETPMEVMLKHLNEEPPPMEDEIASQIPAALYEVMIQMMAKNRDDRPPDCQTLKAELLATIGIDAAAAGMSTSQATATAINTARRNTGTSNAVTAFDRGAIGGAGAKKGGAGKLIAIAAAVLVLIGGGGAAWYFTAGPGGGGDVPKGGASSSAVTVVDDQQAAAEAAAKKAAEAAAAEAAKKAAEAAAAEAAKKATEEAAAEAAKKSAAEAAAKKAAEPVIENVKITVESTPAGAQLYDGETLIGVTPVSFERQKDSGTLELVLKLNGYKDHEFMVGTGANVVQSLQLKRRWVAAPVRRTAPTGSAPKRPSGGDGKKSHGFGTF